jgi:hypothetical protein
VSRGKEEILLSHGADNTQPAKVISTTMQGRNLGVLNSCGALDFSIFRTPDPGGSTNPGESTDSGEDADPGLNAPGTREGNKTDEVTDPGFVATAGVGNMTRQCGDIDHIQPSADPKGLDTGE